MFDRERGGVWGGLWGGGCTRPQKILGLFLLEMTHFGANSVVCFDRNVRLFTARTTTVTVYWWRLTGSSYGERSGEGAVTPLQKTLGHFT